MITIDDGLNKTIIQIQGQVNFFYLSNDMKRKVLYLFIKKTTSKN